jgi:type II secretory pathway predicted ATPase ExeA
MDKQPLPLMQAFGFTRQPFDKNISFKQLFLSKQIKTLFEKLNLFLHRRGIAMITGEIGAGKSTVIRAFTEQLEKNTYDIAYIPDPTIGFKGILNSFAIQLKLETAFYKWKLVENLKYNIQKNASDFNKTTLLIIDEAQLLEPKILEELRMFTNFKIDSVTPLNLILAGQTDFIKTIQLHSMKALQQRISCRFHITGLDNIEAKAYITHHLDVAGRTDTLFTEDAIQEIFQHAKGIPRVINNFCYDCLMEIYLSDKNIVDIPTIEKVLLKWQAD